MKTCVFVSFIWLCSTVSAATYYVNAAASNDSGAATSWGTAKKTIQAAVNLAVAGDTVLVTNGTYNSGKTVTPGGTLSNRVVITQAITVKSVNGANLTIIEGAGTNLYGSTAAVRCVFMTNGVLEGFTLRFGATDTNTSSEINICGGGAYAFGAALSRCVLTNNLAYVGGGAGYGALTNCALAGNRAVWGGGMIFSALASCTLANNVVQYYGGGAYQGSLVDCTLAGNTAPQGGGGSYYGTLSRCTFKGNKTGGNGGGSYYGTLVNCTYSNNTATCGGGSYYSTLANCVLAGNTATWGGGSANGLLDNCTLTGNTATYGGGADSGTLRNSIIYGNAATEGANWRVSAMISYSCTTPLPDGTGNIAADPQLVDSAHIAANSPCVGAGNYSYCSDADIDGEAWLNPPCMGCDQFMAQTGRYLFTVVSAFGGSVPIRATNAYGTVVNAWVTNSPVVNSMTQHVCVGASVVGNAFTQNSATNVSLTVTNTATLTWFWQAKYLLTVATNGAGCVTGVGWYDAGSNVVLTATPAAGWLFSGWSGDTNGCAGTGPELSVAMDRARSVIAAFVMPTVATPVFSPPSGTVFTNELAVAISCATEGAAIRYTLDGSEPTSTSTLYTGMLMLNWDTTVKARAFKVGWIGSAAATAAYDTSVPYFVDASRPDDSGNGLSWATAKKTIQAAVNLAVAGETVIVTNGIYSMGSTVTPRGSLSNRVVITRAITVKSVNGPAVTIIEGSGTNNYGSALAVRCVFMTNGVLDGFTLRKGATLSSGGTANTSGGAVYALGAAPGTEIRACVLTNNLAYAGGGSSYGTLTNCTLTGNKAQYNGGGSYYGVLANCTLSGNTAQYTGGGAHYGVLVNCAISGNKSGNDGGGSYYGALTNCTLTGNSATWGGGSYAGVFYNSIVYGNMAVSQANWYGSVLSFSCTTPLPSGEGNIDADPRLIDAAHVGPGSPCIGAGNYVFSSGTDIDGETWQNPPCMGCDQPVATTGRCLLTVFSASGHAVPSVTTNDYGTVVNAWVTNSPVVNGMTQHVCVGASVVGNAFTQNSATNVSLTLTNNATLTWLWQTNYWLATEASAHGAISVASDWQLMGVTTQITACADAYYHFVAWEGDTGGTTNNPLSLVIDRPRSVTASFAEDLTSSHPTPHWWLAQYGFAPNFEQASQEDSDGDGFPAWKEYVTGSVPTNRDSAFRAQIAVDKGAPQITWAPDLGAARVYAVEGRTNLTAGTWGATNLHCRFFRVSVSLPK